MGEETEARQMLVRLREDQDLPPDIQRDPRARPCHRTNFGDGVNEKFISAPTWPGPGAVVSAFSLLTHLQYRYLSSDDPVKQVPPRCPF